MIFLSIVLMTFSAILLCTEALLPEFGVLGITGIILLVISAIITIFYVPFGVFVICAEYGVLTTAVLGIFRYAKSKQMCGNIILKERLNDDTPEYANLDQLLGRTGLTRTSLRPVGSANFEGTTYEVISDGEFIPKSVKVKAVEIKNQKIMVTRATNAQ